LYSNLVEDRDR